ncbi:hypothetical protein P872_07470 [Rhodonellum psychrophilum GCM71 = DSM 17998]|uniref:Uncharacterized protein n=2 Tax=Rhodonellum TaxID=336827 RepID=U5BZ95_9BACT|nr:hypothetical protein P872_07470 [Rhodonellum psychrophilum GCM71 = DSM 17998]SDZ31795.1 hypothetical protein SAMN05444412_11038 [Rhodonellum ikkaensis]
MAKAKTNTGFNRMLSLLELHIRRIGRRSGILRLAQFFAAGVDFFLLFPGLAEKTSIHLTIQDHWIVK